ncbi:DUF4352 domain-containing protein [Gordonia sp. HY002]|uniref:DUF4352 domain-containing protein n=1 Tax=Gordonia zhenghanii TaxID=2911516 RepID=UPI001EF102D6|nr:DUF4352 domain-containing protein [Gordonia zhenghanii]MCF8569337.1 DUF4352 domain-containing protein [Gordonia zhenghanii]MCF8604380.1 DUF4352 domain-containing protein [Gordonia zhenghanii]
MTNAPPSGPTPTDPQYPDAQYPNPQYPAHQYPSGQYPNAQYQQAPQGGMPYTPPVKKKTKKWPWILGAIVVLIIIIAATSGGGEDSSSAGDTANAVDAVDAGTGAGNEEQTDNGSDAAAMNTPVRDGKFEFVVTDVESGLSEVGDNPYLNEQAQGQFVVVSLTVKNIGDKAQSFSPGDQKLKDSQGREFETDTTAQVALGGSDIAIWDSINPGNTVSIKLVFDMPKNAKPASMELHDSMFSDGADVSLK